MTLAQLLAATYEDTGYQTSPATAVTTRLTRYLNEALQAVVSEPGLSMLLDGNVPYTFASVAAQARYAVPEAVTEILAMTERTNDRALSALSLEQYRRLDPDPTNSSGIPLYYVPLGASPVAIQPSDASELFLDSTSASDTNTAHLTVVTGSGYRRTLSVSMTGTTAVSLSATVNDIVSVEDFYLSAAAVGTVTLHEDASGGTELARITIGAVRPRYTAFYLYPTPAAAVTYYVDYRRELDLLVQSGDEPALPLDFHPMLVKYATFREWELKDDERATIAFAQYKKWLGKLKYRLTQSGDSMPVATLGGRLTGHSRLGGMYPADIWVRG
jgi:hypothetical protein